MKPSTILYMIILATFILSAMNFSQDSGQDDIIGNIETKYMEGDADFFLWGGLSVYSYLSIVPAIEIETLNTIPVIGEFYAWWSSLFLTDGYIHLPSFTTAIYILLILLIVSVFAISEKHRKNLAFAPFKYVILAILLIFLLYPVWDALHIWLFEVSFSNLSGITMEQAKSFYLTNVENMTYANVFYIFSTILGFAGAVKIGNKGWKG